MLTRRLPPGVRPSLSSENLRRTEWIGEMGRTGYRRQPAPCLLGLSGLGSGYAGTYPIEAVSCTIEANPCGSLSK